MLDLTCINHANSPYVKTLIQLYVEFSCHRLCLKVISFNGSLKTMNILNDQGSMSVRYTKPMYVIRTVGNLNGSVLYM